MSAFETALTQLDRAASLTHLPHDVLERLRHPDREIVVSIPVRMDDGTLRMFTGFRVEHNNARGPYKGGIRYHEQVEINEVRALSLWMTMKCAVAGIPMGGGKGGVTVNPKTLSKGELERLSRGWVRALADVLGPRKDVPAPDVNTTPEIMAWMADEFGKITGDTSGAVITGKPIEHGGSEGRGTSTAQGGFYVFEELRGRLNLPERCRVAIQGFGNAGLHAAYLWTHAGHTLIAASDSKGAIYKTDGIDPADLEVHKKTTGSVMGFAGSRTISNAELLISDCDVLIPAALENQITKDNAAAIRASVIFELANGPTNVEADDILFARGIPVVPDILANSGGVTGSYFEWEQNLHGEHWSEGDVFAKLEPLMREQARAVFDHATAARTDLRRGAFILALERLAEAMK